MYSAVQKRITDLLEVGQNKDTASQLVDGLLIVFISLNVVAVVLESVNFLRETYYEPLLWFEYLSVGVFTIEYVLRVWSIPRSREEKFRNPITGRLRYMVTFMALVDLIAILPFFLGYFLSVDLRFLRAVRVIRILKISRYSSTLSMILNVFKEESHAFVAAFFLLFVLLILTSSGIYLIEGKIQPEAFGSIPAAMWWAMATLTTVGYGDVTPITPLGKLFGGCITIIGIGTVALPAGILASGFSEQLRRNRAAFSEEVSEALEDGVVSADEQIQLETMRETLGLSSEEADLILRNRVRHQQEHLETVEEDFVACPHCLLPVPIPGISPSACPDSSYSDQAPQ